MVIYNILDKLLFIWYKQLTHLTQLTLPLTCAPIRLPPPKILGPLFTGISPPTEQSLRDTLTVLPIVVITNICVYVCMDIL